MKDFTKDRKRWLNRSVPGTLGKIINIFLVLVILSSLTAFAQSAGPVYYTVQFNQASYTVNEDVGLATFNITLDRPYEYDNFLLVYYNAHNGTANNISNFRSPVNSSHPDIFDLSHSVIFSKNDLFKLIQIPIINDHIYNSPDLNFSVNITYICNLTGISYDPNVYGLSNGNATVTILESPPTVQFEANSYTVNENDGTATVNVTISHAIDSDVVVHYMTSDGTALDGTNYTAKSGTITFPANINDPQPITVPIIDDAKYGGNTFFFVNLTSVDDDKAGIGSPAATQVTIKDDEQIFTVNLYKGWNMISSPLVITPFKASIIQSMSSAITQVMRYDTNSKQYLSFIIDSSPSFLDFDIKTDEGYLVYCTSDSSITFTGKLPVSRTIELNPGWSMVGWSTLTSSNTTSVTGAISGSQQVMTYDTTSKSYISYIEGASPEFLSLAMVPGAGYLIFTDTDTTLAYGGV